MSLVEAARRSVRVTGPAPMRVASEAGPKFVFQGGRPIQIAGRITQLQATACAGMVNAIGSCNGSVFHFLTSGSTCLTKHFRFRSASS